MDRTALRSAPSGARQIQTTDEPVVLERHKLVLELTLPPGAPELLQDAALARLDEADFRLHLERAVAAEAARLLARLGVRATARVA